MAKRILVVDDEKECCDFFANYLTGRGYFVDIAYDGKKGKELLETSTYDFVFLDCNMPELSGVELVKVINKKNPGARKIMISGYDSIDEDFAKEIGIDLFLSKPLSLESIKKIVEGS